MSFEASVISRPTPEQIEEWEKQYKKIFHIVVEDKEIWIKKPSRASLDAATIASRKAPSKFDEVLMKSNWLAGDKDIFDEGNEDYFYAFAEQLGEVIVFKKGEIKKN